MRNTYKSIMDLTMVLFLMSCSKVVGQNNPDGNNVVISAYFAENNAKTMVQEGGMDVYWEPGDEVKMFFKGNGGRFATSITTPSLTATFNGALFLPGSYHEGFSAIKPVMYGLYPYREDAVSDGNTVTTLLPSEQMGKAGSFAQGMNISLGQSETSSMGFYNVCGGIRFSLAHEGVNNVVLEGRNGESIAGRIRIGFEGGVPAVKEIIDSLSSITLTAPSGGTFEIGKWYYITALPGSLDNGFKMRFNTAAGYAELKSDSPVAIKRGIYGSIADADKDLKYLDTLDASLKDVSKVTLASAGNGANIYRIPSVVICKDSSLLAFAELRYNSWGDKSYTDIVCWKSRDLGKTWGQKKTLTASANGGNYAFMDPTPVVDDETGEVFLFCTRWVKLNTDATNNKAFLLRSTDNGDSFGTPVDISTSSIFDGTYSAGFGPGHGICLKEGNKKGRMVVITRQFNGTVSKGYSIYSDNHGETWQRSTVMTYAGEAQIAEPAINKLYANLRRGATRYSFTSSDGGNTWSSAVLESALPVLEKGCEDSVLGLRNNMLFYCGPAGTDVIDGHDNRYNLTLFRSSDAGESWTKNVILSEKASGYSDMLQLPDGRIVLIYEAGPEQGFVKLSGNRPAGWMRLDILTLPSKICDERYWIR